jgi:ferredoxin
MARQLIHSFLVSKHNFNEFNAITKIGYPAGETITSMAELAERLPVNQLGRFYVDATCIDCDLCRETAPAFFRRDPELGQSFVHQQPVTEGELALAQAALESCPTNSIGEDGQMSSQAV